MIETKTLTAERMGYTAARNGHPYTANPYQGWGHEKRENEAWLRGWQRGADGLSYHMHAVA
jgi:ribosome modulation factor